MTTPPPDTKVETLEETAERIVLEVAANPELVSYPDAGDRQLWYRAVLSALLNEREAHLRLTDREAQILIEHHNYEAEKAITRTGCREKANYHRNRAAAIREGR